MKDQKRMGVINSTLKSPSIGDVQETLDIDKAVRVCVPGLPLMTRIYVVPVLTHINANDVRKATLC